MPVPSARLLRRLATVFSCVLGGLAAAGPLEAQRGHSPIRLLPGVHFQTVTRFTGSLSVMFVSARDLHGVRGAVVGAEAATGGGKLRLGVGNWAGSSGAFLGASLLRTWGSPRRVAEGQTFLGGEVRVTWYLVALTAGYYWRVSGDVPGDNKVLNLGVGVVY